jgi:hypothetical protein
MPTWPHNTHSKVQKVQRLESRFGDRTTIQSRNEQDIGTQKLPSVIFCYKVPNSSVQIPTKISVARLFQSTKLSVVLNGEWCKTISFASHVLGLWLSDPLVVSFYHDAILRICRHNRRQHWQHHGPQFLCITHHTNTCSCDAVQTIDQKDNRHIRVFVAQFGENSRDPAAKRYYVTDNEPYELTNYCVYRSNPVPNQVFNTLLVIYNVFNNVKILCHVLHIWHEKRHESIDVTVHVLETWSLPKNFRLLFLSSFDYAIHENLLQRYCIAVFVTLWLCVRGNGIIHRAHKAIQGDDCRPRRSSWLRFPWFTPILNSFELRCFYSRSYFGPRTCVGGITNFIEVDRLSIRVSPSHP